MGVEGEELREPSRLLRYVEGSPISLAQLCVNLDWLVSNPTILLEVSATSFFFLPLSQLTTILTSSPGRNCEHKMSSARQR